MSEPRPLGTVEIDGVVADLRYRLSHMAARVEDWDAFFRAAPLDPPHPPGIELALRLAETTTPSSLPGGRAGCGATPSAG